MSSGRVAHRAALRQPANRPATASFSASTSARSSAVPPFANSDAFASLSESFAAGPSSARASMRLANPFRTWPATRCSSAASARARSAAVEGLWEARPNVASSKREIACAERDEWQSPKRSRVPSGLTSIKLGMMPGTGRDGRPCAPGDAVIDARASMSVSFTGCAVRAGVEPDTARKPCRAEISIRLANDASALSRSSR